jgi:hypothetical protein
VTNGASRGTQYTLAVSRSVDLLIISIADGAPQRIPAESLPTRIRLQEATSVVGRIR